MSDLTTLPPAVPPPLNPASSLPASEESPEERIPINGYLGAAEAILRQPRRLLWQLRQERPGPLVGKLFLIGFLCSLVYGLVVGTFSRGDQLWAAPVKIAGGVLLSALICLPSLYIFSCLGGSRARLVEVFGLLAGLLTLTTVLLIGFAPVAWVFSESTKSLAAISALHLAFWLIATIFGLRFLGAGFSRLGAGSSAGLRVWMVIFLLVSLQMSTALRPIVGTASTFFPTEKQFFLAHWLECLK